MPSPQQSQRNCRVQPDDAAEDTNVNYAQLAAYSCGGGRVDLLRSLGGVKPTAHPTHGSGGGGQGPQAPDGGRVEPAINSMHGSGGQSSCGQSQASLAPHGSGMAAVVSRGGSHAAALDFGNQLVHASVGSGGTTLTSAGGGAVAHSVRGSSGGDSCSATSWEYDAGRLSLRAACGLIMQDLDAVLVGMQVRRGDGCRACRQA